MKLISTQGEDRGSIEIEMALPSRWCPVCDQIRSPDVCARILPGGDDSQRCGAPTIHNADLDPATRARYRTRLAELAGGAAVNA